MEIRKVKMILLSIVALGIGFAGGMLMAQYAGSDGNLFGVLQGIGLLVASAAMFALSGMLVE